MYRKLTFFAKKKNYLSIDYFFYASVFEKYNYNHFK